jgi:DHA1 family bicyclomycin/chloramphenicol resistance-like MFS transporter
MVLLGSSLALVAVLAQSVILVSGYITPSAIFLPCFFITCAQGLSLPYGQAGAMAIIPRIAGTAAGVGVFVQNVVGALFAQLYGLLADGSIWPIVLVTIASASLGVLAAIPLAIMRARRHSAL